MVDDLLRMRPAHAVHEDAGSAMRLARRPNGRLRGPGIGDVAWKSEPAHLLRHLGYALGSIRLAAQLHEAADELRRVKTLESAFEHSPVGILVTGPDGTVTSANPRALELLNGSTSPQGTVGKVRVRKLLTLDSREARSQLERLFSHGDALDLTSSTGGRGRPAVQLRCRAVAVIGDGDRPRVEQTIWIVEELAAPPADAS